MKKLSITILLVVVGLAFYLVARTATDASGSGVADCPTFMDEAQLGAVESSLLTEISGVVASRENADVLWTHNDSGDSARIYAMSIQGKHLGVYNLVGASATDWEDIAIGPGPVEGQDYVYAGDIGDNARQRASVTVYRVAEPVVSASQDAVTVDLDGVDALPMRYPGSAVYDSETLLVDPVSGDLFLVTKDRAGEGVAHIFRNPAPHTPGVMVTLDLVDSIPLPAQVTGGDVSPSGDAVLLRLYAQAYYWPRATGTNLWETFSSAACAAPVAVEPQGEAIAFAAHGVPSVSPEPSYFTISEGAYQPVYFYEQDTSIDLVPTGSTWTYLDDGSDQGVAWRQTDFDDAGWASGPAQLGYGDGDEATVVSYGGDAGNKHITTYFRHSFDVADASIFESLMLRVLRDDGAVVYLNGTEVFRTNMSGGATGYDTLAASTIGGSNESAFFATSIDTAILNTGSNVVAVEIHQGAVTSSDISFDLELQGWEQNDNRFTFAVTADMRGSSGPGRDSPQYFRGACEAIATRGGGAFMVSPGDIDPTSDVRWTITSTLGVTYTWYPGVGNHELPGAGNESYSGSNMDWLRSYDYDSVNPGPSGCPETTYSFDYANAHFVMLNEYCDTGGDTVRDGDVVDHLYDWLVADLSATDKTHVFVFGHEPAYPQPDADNGRTRHLGDSLDKYPTNRDRFWNLLRDEGVIAYVYGHTHNYSAIEIDGVWQLDAGHARGQGDTGARSTFIVISVGDSGVTFKTYRDDADGGPYTLAHTGTLRECVAGYDLDCDCDVDVADIMPVAAHWHTTVGDGDYDPTYDLDDDGDIDVADIMLVATQWGNSC
ncbi:MAG: metallophosphoesterase family protein [Anaerolineae bacterium]